MFTCWYRNNSWPWKKKQNRKPELGLLTALDLSYFGRLYSRRKFSRLIARINSPSPRRVSKCMPPGRWVISCLAPSNSRSIISPMGKRSCWIFFWSSRAKDFDQPCRYKVSCISNLTIKFHQVSVGINDCAPESTYICHPCKCVVASPSQETE